MRSDCVSRPVHQDLCGFFNDYRYLQAHCVSRPIPVQLPQRVNFDRLTFHRTYRHSMQLRPQPRLLIVARVTSVPRLTRPAVSLPLAIRITTGVLATSRPPMRLKPSATDSTGTLVNHPLSVTRSPTDDTLVDPNRCQWPDLNLMSNTRHDAGVFSLASPDLTVPPRAHRN